MSYLSGNRWFNTDPLELHASAEETENGNGPSVETDRGVARLTLDVTAQDGDDSQTLDVTVETSADDSTWRDVASFAQVGAATASERLCFAGLDRFVRVSWTVGGTGSPAYTFEVSGEAA